MLISDIFKMPEASKQIPDINAFIRTTNLKRVTVVGLLFLFFDLLNIVNLISESNYSSLVMAVEITVAAASVVYIIASRVLFKKLDATPWAARLFYLSLWVVLYLGMIPMFAVDIAFSLESGRTVLVNMTLFCEAMLIIPIFLKKEIPVIYAIFTVANIVIGVIYNAPLPYYVYAVGLAAGTAALSYAIQYQYIKMISGLDSEARTDPLTGLLNRRGGMLKANTVFELCRRHNWLVVVYILDIDHFKNYNDIFGHKRGDEVLISVSNAIKTVFSRSSDVLCRYGGDEFLIVACINTEKEAEALAEKLRTTVEEMNIPAPQITSDKFLTVSIGYTVFEKGKWDENDLDALILSADKALYRATDLGRNRAEKAVK